MSSGTYHCVSDESLIPIASKSSLAIARWTTPITSLEANSLPSTALKKAVSPSATTRLVRPLFRSNIPVRVLKKLIREMRVGDQS